MEKIRINAIDKKPSGLVIVKYTSLSPETPIQNVSREATLNTKWQSQEVDYLEKDVGVGGEVSVMIVQKGDYTNITKVDMTSGVKGHGVPNQEVHTGEVLKSVADVRGNSIIAQCLTKIEYRNVPQPMPMDIMASYRWYLKELD